MQIALAHPVFLTADRTIRRSFQHGMYDWTQILGLNTTTDVTDMNLSRLIAKQYVKKGPAYVTTHSFRFVDSMLEMTGQLPFDNSTRRLYPMLTIAVNTMIQFQNINVEFTRLANMMEDLPQDAAEFLTRIQPMDTPLNDVVFIEQGDSEDDNNDDNNANETNKNTNEDDATNEDDE